MSKITIEEINGKTYTVVYSEIIDTEAAAANWSGLMMMWWHGRDLDSGAMRGYCKTGKLYWTALPPLPRNPTADDAKLLHLYASYGLIVCGSHNDYKNEELTCMMHWLNFFDEHSYNYTITHVLDEQGNKVEVAIIDREDK